MRLLIEEYQYNAPDVKESLSGLDVLENIDHLVSVNYVGYFYNPAIRDCVFILPKVLMNQENLVFGRLKPEEIIDFDNANGVSPVERNFIYEFAVWIYRAITVFNKSKRGNDIVYHRQVTQMGGNKRHKSQTFLDVLLSLVRFNRENQDFFMFTMKNLRSGLNKINWTRTIAHSAAIVQDGSPVYISPVNKKRQINFDEELLVIFFSTLNYISETYGFPVSITLGFELIRGKRFEQFLDGQGKVRLRQIKYKYFSDKALQIWDLCYAFFDKAYQIRINAEQKEYLLVKNFNIVFEAIIDELIGDRNIPVGLKEQYDGKRVDHMYSWQGLIENDEKPIYYIGDSKYYKLGNDVGKESVYKQYTYARNVIQWNLDLFMDGKQKSSDVKLRDDVTEGYNVIPNFFISAKMDSGLSYADRVDETERRHPYFVSRQFENRLFDRDTLLVFHYDVNFLYVVSLYARDNAGQKVAWRNKVRDIFREKIQEILGKQYQFYAMRQHPGVDGVKYIREHFKQLLGKVYTPFEDKGIYSLALEDPSAVPKDRRCDVARENAEVLESLRESFYVEACELGRNPEEVLPPSDGAVPMVVTSGKDGVLMVMMENFGAKASRFLSDGRIAVGLKYSRESMEIVEHIGEIGYVMFHNRRRDGQHLFAVKSCSGVICQEAIDDSVYRNVGTCEIYLVVEFDGEQEVDSSELDCARVECTPKTRYDAQFARWEKLK
ncbi:MAG: hypothetical protein ACLVGR_07775 [Anaerovoracaceae bacterium]